MNTDYPLSTHVDIAPYSGRRKVPARVLWLQAIVLIAFAAMQGLVSRTWAAEMPKLRIRTVGPNAHRLIEDKNGKPFFMAGICPQNLVQKISTANMNAYFKARHDQGFNAAWVMVSGWDHYAKPPMLTGTGYSLENNVHDVAGNAIKVDPADPNFAPPNLNMAYVKSVDQMVIAAGNNGIYLFLDPMNEPGMEWPKHSQADCVAWGKFWGDRYAKYPYVNILMGSDDLPQPYSNWIVSGLEQSLSDRLYCIDQGLFDPAGKRPDMPNPWWQYVVQHATWINLWGWYAYETPKAVPRTTYQYATWTMYTQAAHWGVRTAPTFIVETEYTSYPPDHGEGTGQAEEGIVMKQGDHALRRQLWSVSLGGGTGFGIIGNINDAVNDPLTTLNDPALKYVVYCKSFFTSRRWDRLAPDYAHTFLTSQTSGPALHDPTYVSAALTSDGSFGAVYYPGLSGNAFKLALNMSKMGGGGGTSNVYWFDPTSGATHSIAGGPFANAGSRTFTTPGKNSAGSADWVLVVQATTSAVD